VTWNELLYVVLVLICQILEVINPEGKEVGEIVGDALFETFSEGGSVDWVRYLE
jgi:hypothetical protein